MVQVATLETLPEAAVAAAVAAAEAGQEERRSWGHCRWWFRWLWWKYI